MTRPAGRQHVEDPARLVAARLAEVHPATRKARRDPLDELVLTILSQNTSDVNRDRGWDALRERYPSWEDVLAAPVRELEDAIRPAGLARQKAAAIRSALERLRDEVGRPSLRHLEPMTDAEAVEYLTGFPGVGPKTAACVLCFALGREVMPVDTHVHRLAVRLGLVPERADAARTQRILNEVVPSELRYELHLLLIRHGRSTCRARNPRCDGCPVADVCPRIGVRGSP